MVRHWLILLFVLVSLACKAGDTIPVFRGVVSRHALFNQPELSNWFFKEYINYQPGFNAVERLRSRLSRSAQLRVVVVFGSWCPDSRLELPRLVKVLDLAGFDTSAITFLAVDRSKESTEPAVFSGAVKFVPTIIVTQGNKETGRIIEHPHPSFEAELLKIFRRLKNPNR